MKLGCQARSFGEGIYPDEDSFLWVVAQVGKLGFVGLEANWRNMDRYFGRPEALSRILEGAGLALIGPHYGGAVWDPGARQAIARDLDAIVPFAAAVGAGFVVCSSPQPRGDGGPLDACRRMADPLNEFGAICAQHGLRLAYHNHAWEASPGCIERLVQLTDPERVAFAFDTGNHIQGGGDPAAAILALGSRTGILHLKDGRGEQLAELGKGDLNVAAVRSALRAVGFGGWVVLEEEKRAGDAGEHVERCLPLLRSVLA